MNKGHIVVVEDDAVIGKLLEDFLTQIGYRISLFPLATEALAAMRTGELSKNSQNEVDLIISDIKMVGLDGMDFLKILQKERHETPVILITASGDIDSAIEAMKNGAYHYITKPFKIDEMLVVVERSMEKRSLTKENKFLRQEVQKKFSLNDHFIGKSQPMQQIFSLIQKVSGVTSNVLITGESGTGKEVVAKAIHHTGPRSAKPFIAINCTAIPETLLESELFGHAKGSFTGAVQRKRGLLEEANGGTLFLDEIGDMSPSLQAKILRVIQERKIRPVGDNQSYPVDVRIIAATHKDLRLAIKNGLFREDLFYRLSVIPIVIPPLRDRSEDIPVLAQYFLDKFVALTHSSVRGFSKRAMEKLLVQRWEGNVRELENTIERALVLCSGEMIEDTDIPDSLVQSAPVAFYETQQDLPTLSQLEERYIRSVLEKTGGRKNKASRILGINRRTLCRKEKEYGWATGKDALN